MNTNMQNFANNPVSFVAKHGGVFDCVGTKAHVRRDGTPTQLRVWRGRCAVCSSTFEFATPLAVVDDSNSQSFGRKHCDAHKLTQAQITQRWVDAIHLRKAAKRAGVEDLV